MLIETNLDNSYISYQHEFKSDTCNPPHHIRTEFAINTDFSDEPDVFNHKSYKFTTWGVWGDDEHQFDLEFSNKQEAYRFVKGMIDALKLSESNSTNS